jgi:hypothetical protein
MKLVDKETKKKTKKNSKMLTTLQKGGGIIPMAMG